jgi:hypothetical protein
LKRSLLETFAINERANQKLLETLSDGAWRASPPVTSGRKFPASAEGQTASRAEVLESLQRQREAAAQFAGKGFAECGWTSAES